MSALLQRLPLQVYGRPISLFHGSTVGQHFRHILEFYTCLLEGCDNAFVNYSGRQRNEAISDNPEVALSVLESIAAAVVQLDAEQVLQVESEFSDGLHDKPAYVSSIGRELQYAFDHAVHHLAIIRMGLETHFPEIPVDPDLGVAPSTLRHRKACTAPAV
jgi:hypothetical protein